MDFIELCKKRRSYRKYTDQAIEADKIDYILKCALMSPSGKRQNPWEFIVTTDREKLKQLSGCRTYGSQMFDTATGGIVIALDSSLIDTWMADGAIAAQNIMLAATEQGLGCCWCHVYQREGAEEMIKKVFGIPENLTILCVISLGYKDEERQEYKLEKLLYNKVHLEQY